MRNMTALFLRAIRSSISLRLLSVAFGFVSSVLINRALGLNLRGDYTVVTTYSSLVQSVACLGLSFAYAPLSSEVGEDKARSSILCVSLLQAALYGAIALGIVILSRQPTVCWTAVISVALTLNGQIAFMALIDDIASRNRILLFSSLIYVLLDAGVLLVFPGNLDAVLICYLFKLVFEVLVLWINRGYSLRVLHLPNGDMLSKMLKYGVPTAFLALLILFNYNIDVVLLNYFEADDAQVGIFGVALSLANMLWFIPDAFKEYVYYKSAHGNAAQTTAALIVANVGVCVVICVGFMLLGRWFLGFFYGQEYVEAFPATMTVFVGVIPMVAFKLIHPLYVNEGKLGSVVLLLMIAIASNVLSAVVSIPALGAYGAALSTVLSYTVCGVLFIAKFFKDYELSFKELPGYCRSLLESVTGR